MEVHHKGTEVPAASGSEYTQTVSCRDPVKSHESLDGDAVHSEGENSEYVVTTRGYVV